MKLIRKTALVTIIFIMSTVILSACSLTDKNEKTAEAFSLMQNLEYENAIAMFEEALSNNENEREIYRGEGIAYIGLGRYEDAITYIEKALALSSGIVNGMDYDLNYYLATAYYKSGNADEAIKIYDAILSLKPDDTDAKYLRGVIYSEKNMLDEAMESFNEVIKADPENYDRIIQIYVILADNGYKEVGQSYLKNAMENGTKQMSNYEKGQISFYLEDYESAKTYLEKARDEEGYEAVLLLGKTYETLGDNNYAVSVYSSYATGEEGSAEILNEMGLCKLAMNDYQGALSAFQDAMNIQDNSITQTLKYNEIVAYEYLGDFETAKRLMTSYIKNYPDDEKAARENIFLKTR